MGIEDSIFINRKAEVLREKAIDGGDATNLRYIKVPEGSTSTLAALTRHEGVIAYDTDQNSLVVDDGSGFQAVGGGIALTDVTTGSYIKVSNPSGNGSSSTCIRRFQTLDESGGTAITRASSAAAGDTFTVAQAGVYAVTYNDDSGTGAGYLMGLSKNATGADLTTSIGSIAATKKLIIINPNDSLQTSVTWVGVLAAGDVIRAHNSGAAEMTTSNPTRSTLTIVQIVKI